MDYNNHKNIEEWFMSLPSHEFPDNKNYPHMYSGIKKMMDDQIHDEIKAIAVSIVPEEFLNNHGSKHVNTVMNRASKLMKDVNFRLSPYETFLLLMGIQLHDAGHIINGRKEHEKNIAPILNKIGGDMLDSTERKFIFKIAKAHSGKDDPIGQMLEQDHFLGVECRLRLLSAIIRLADELADDCLRASTFLLNIQSKAIKENSKIFHIYSDRLKSCMISPAMHEIEQKFELSIEDVMNSIETTTGEVFLVDDILTRAKKTFTECIYCNRFFPETIRITRLKIVVSFVDKDVIEDFMDPITLRIEEKGYPSLNWNSIYDICDDILFENGVKIDGKYLQSKLVQQ